MPDDLRIPTPASELGRMAPATRYRARPVHADRGPFMLKLGAAGLAALLLLGAGGWAVWGRKPGTIPLIEADKTPVRVKPADPGGMQVVGAEEMGGDQGKGSERMAPPAESPAPQALRAQVQQDAAAPAPVVPAAPQPGASPLPDTPPVPRPGLPAATAAPAPAKPAAEAPAARPAGTGVQVQLAAVDSEEAARAEWQRLAKRMPELLGERRPALQKAERDGKAIWRVRTGPFADTAEATAFCGKLRAKGGNCTIASF